LDLIIACRMAEISLCQGPKPAVSAGRKKTFRCFVVWPINCHSESENFLKFLLTRANFSRFNPGEVSWIIPFSETSPGDFSTGIYTTGFRSSENEFKVFSRVSFATKVFRSLLLPRCCRRKLEIRIGPELKVFFSLDRKSVVSSPKIYIGFET
jgi:hypothetical protein